MKKLYLHLLSTTLMCLLSLWVFAQPNLTDFQLDLQVNQNSLELAMQDMIEANPNPKHSNFTPARVSPTDLDDDGMDDTWETNNGLDPSNPKDAWWDADGDHILNLFEFQLITNPNDANDPNIIEVLPGISPNDFRDLFEEADNSLRVIRLTEGDYPPSGIQVYYSDFRIMVQGGWNSDFTVYDPALYHTTMTDVGEEALRILTPFNNQDINKSAIIAEGIRFRATDYFSFGGTVQLSMNSGDSFVCIKDCDMSDGTYYGLSISHKDLTDSATVFLVNNVIANNISGGTYSQNADNTYARWRMYNNTIHNPNSPEGGMSGLTALGGVWDIEFTNGINWGNGGPAFNFSPSIVVDIQLNHSNADFISSVSVPVTSINSIDDNPLFEDPTNHDFALMANSPCIDGGVDIGLLFSGVAPDMGAVELQTMSSTVEALDLETKVFPNPASSHFSIQMEQFIGQAVEVTIFNPIGELLYRDAFDYSGTETISIDHLPNGLMLMNFMVEGQPYFTKLIKQ